MVMPLPSLTEHVPEIRGLELLQPVWLVKVSDHFHVLTANVRASHHRMG